MLATVAAIAAIGTGTQPAAVPSAASEPGIVVQRSIAGVGIEGQTLEEVEGAWGPASTVRRVDGPIAFLYASWRGSELEAGFVDSADADHLPADRATSLYSVATRNRAHRTAAGVGVGSPEAMVKRRVRRVSCSTYRGRRSCSVGEPGEPLTTFSIRRGRVYEVSLAVVI